MDRTVLKEAFRKAFLVCVSFFASTTVFVAFFSLIEKTVIYPEILIRLAMIYLVLFFVTAGRIVFAKSKWALNMPYILPNLIFMPLYLGVTIIGLFFKNDMFNMTDFISLVVGFVIVFCVANVIRYYIDKLKTDKMNDALNEFHKEHLSDGYEEE